MTIPKGIPKKEILMAYIINLLMPENPEKSEKKLLEFPFLEILMDYIIKFDGLKNPEKSKENYKNFLFWKF